MVLPSNAASASLLLLSLSFITIAAAAASPPSSKIDCSQDGPRRRDEARRSRPRVDLLSVEGVVTAIEKGVASKEMRLIARANCLMLLVRRQLTASIVNSFLHHALSAGLDALARLLPFAAVVETSEKDMEVDTPLTAGQSHASQKQSVLLEVEIFCYLLVNIFLIDQKQLDEAKACSSTAVRRLQQLNPTTACSLAVKRR